MTYDVPLRFLPDDPIYEGHFPGRPVTPGVCQIEAVRQACCRLLGLRLRFSRIVDCKFVAPIVPGSGVYSCSISLSVVADGAEGAGSDAATSYRLSAVISDSESVRLKLRAELQPLA